MDLAASNLLMFSAHAADFCSRCGGVIALHTSAGAKVHVVDLIFGERGESEGYWSTGAAQTQGVWRRPKSVRALEEARRAAEVLAVTIQFLDYDDYPLHHGSERRKLARIMRERYPSLVLTRWKIGRAILTVSIMKSPPPVSCGLQRCNHRPRLQDSIHSGRP